MLLPFVAVFGLATNGAVVAAVLGAVNVGLCWLDAARRHARAATRPLLGTIFYGFGTVAWYAAMLGTTWFLAHVVASTFLFLAIGVASAPTPSGRAGRRCRRCAPSSAWRRPSRGASLVAGLLFGTAAPARA